MVQKQRVTFTTCFTRPPSAEQPLRPEEQEEERIVRAFLLARGCLIEPRRDGLFKIVCPAGTQQELSWRGIDEHYNLTFPDGFTMQLHCSRFNNCDVMGFKKADLERSRASENSGAYTAPL